MALVLAGLVLAAALVVAATPERTDDAPPLVAPPVVVRAAVDPVLSEVARWDREDGKPGLIGFELEDGETLTGVETARLFAEERGVPKLIGAHELASAQFPGGVDVRQWLARRSPSGVWFLQYSLGVVRDGVRESRAGWARIDATVLTHASLTVRPRVGERTRFRVATSDGTPVPGAFVAVDVVPLEPGTASVFLYTDERGECVLSGIEPDLPLVARLPDGVGPARDVVESRFRAPAPEVDLPVDSLQGDWEFARHQCWLGFPGASTTVRSIATPRSSLPEAWPVSRYVGPGRGRLTPFFLMYPAAAAGGEALTADIEFAGFPPVTLPDVRTASRIEFPR